MTVLGFYFTTVNAHVDEKNLFGNLSITSTPTIEGVEKKNLDATGMKETVGIRFKYVTSYEKAGEIELQGELLYQVADAKKIERLWKENKRMEDEMALDVLNFVIRRCVAKTIELSDVLRLPPPIQFPTVTKTSEVKASKK